jgi:WD40 repeat protein
LKVLPLMKIATLPLTALIAVLSATAWGASFDDFIREKTYDGGVAKTLFVIKDSFPVTSLAWSGDGSYLASASTHANLVHVWSVKDRKRVTEIKLATSPSYFHSSSWSPDGRYLAVCDGYEGLRIFDAHTWHEAHKFDRTKVSGCQQSTFSQDGKQLALLNGEVRILDVVNWREISVFDVKATEPGSRLEALSFVPGTHTLVLGGSAWVEIPDSGHNLRRTAGFVWILDPQDPGSIRKIQIYRPYTVDGGAGTIVSVVVNRDGLRFATGTRTGDGVGAEVTRQSVHILSYPAGTLIAAPLENLPFGAQTGLTYSSDGRFLVVGHEDPATRAIHLIETSESKVVDTITVRDSVIDIASNPTRPEFAASFGNQIAAWTTARTH